MRRRSLLLLLPALAAAFLVAAGLRPEAPPRAPAGPVAEQGGGKRTEPDRSGRGGRAADGPVRVVDGDTLRIGARRIRLYGIDAPEHAQRCADAAGRPYACGEAAAAALTRLIGGRQPDCAERDRDRYGRSVAVCTLDGRDLNRAMVAGGWALAYLRYARDYAPDEAAARQARRGLWQGSFERPDQYRAERRGRRG